MLRKIFLGRLPRYFAFVFLKHLLLIMLVFGALIYLITFVEILRKTAGDDFSMAIKVAMTAKQIPFVMEQILPLLMLITAIWTVISLSYKSELVVAKAAGMSQWRIITNFSCISLFIGLLTVFIVNPLSTKWIKEYYEWNATRKMKVIYGFSEKIVNDKKDVIITAKKMIPQKAALEDIEIFYLDEKKILEKFLYAKEAKVNVNDKNLLLENVRIFSDNKLDALTKEKYIIFFPEIEPFLEVQTKVGDLYDFYEYPDIIERAFKNNTNHVLLRSQYYGLITFPILCAVMTMVAVLTAPHSLRKGGVFKIVALGLFFGFSIYVLDIILMSLGRAEILPLWISVIFMKVFSIVALLWFVLWREYGYAE